MNPNMLPNGTEALGRCVRATTVTNIEGLQVYFEVSQYPV